MTRDEALAEADVIIETLLASGDKDLFDMARDEAGNVDQAKLVAAAMRSRSRIADMLMAQESKRPGLD